MNTQLVKEKQDLTYLSWSVYRNSSGTAGSFLKSYSELGGKKVYYKLSNFDKRRQRCLLKNERPNRSAFCPPICVQLR